MPNSAVPEAAKEGETADSSDPRTPGRLRAERLALVGALIVLAAAIWVEPPGSYLAEPDEARYAEIPREMLASGDFLTPRVNGLPYLEKPPLLYWANAASMRLFGLTPWSARLTARLAGLGTAILLGLALARLAGLRAGLIAAALFLSSPLGFVLSRLNVTDGLLTFFFTAMLLGSLLLLRDRRSRKESWLLGALLGVAAAGSFLTKGLVGVFLAGGILLLWSLATGRARDLGRLLLGPALPIFAALTVPWFLLMERERPGFLQFFFVKEHFQRFTTTIHGRQEPAYFFLVVFLLGFLPGLALLALGLKRLGPLRAWRRAHPEALFFLFWIVAVLAFFSISGSKLIPYILPAFPAAAALTALGTAREDRTVRGVWIFHAVVLMLMIGVAATNSEVQAWVSDYGLGAFAKAAWLSLVAGALLPFLGRRRTLGGSVAAVSLGWAVFYIVLGLAWPRTPAASEVHGLAEAARGYLRAGGAELVAYRTYLHGFPWELRSLLPVVNSGGEIGEALAAANEQERKIAWTHEKFWHRWRTGRPLLVLVRERDLDHFDGTGVSPRLLARGSDHLLVSNVD